MVPPCAILVSPDATSPAGGRTIEPRSLTNQPDDGNASVAVFDRQTQHNSSSRSYNQFNVQRHLISRRTLKALRDEAFAGWRKVVAA